MIERTHQERLAIAETDIERIQLDINNIAEQHREAVKSLSESIHLANINLADKLDKIDKKVSRFEWIMSGITMTIAAIAWIAGVFNINIGDIKK